MQMIRKRSVQYTSRKSSFHRRESRSKLNSSKLKKNDHDISCSKRCMLKIKPCMKKRRTRKSILNERGKTIQKGFFRSWPASKLSGEKSSNLGNRRSVTDADGDVGTKRRYRRKKKRKKAIVPDEASRLQRRTRYLLIRMKLEQNLIDAYSAEGWKGQSREKIKPEKELQRARKQILNCKLGIRDAIHQLELLSSEGCIEDSVIYPDGSVHHEHIFCAKCKSREASPDNDIILCDGTCNCGFHQKCLEPPLTKIPPGDQGWLCKFCECKMEILEAINAHLGTCFCVNNSWEDVFKEAATSLDGGNMFLDPSEEWPSEDSEDGDYQPETIERSNSMTSNEDDISDNASISSSACYCSDEASSESRRPLNDGDYETRRHRRQRRDVDYKKLYVEMFGKDQHENEQSEDEDWGPHRRKQKRLESDEGTDMDSCVHANQRREMRFTRDIEQKRPLTSEERKPLFRIPRDAVEKLRQVFAENELPSRAVKEDLSKQLGLASEKVSKWFKNARYAALKIRKAEGTEVLSDYIKSIANIRKNQNARAVTLEDKSYFLPSAEIHAPRNLRKNLQRKNLKPITPHLRKHRKRAARTLPTNTTEVSKWLSTVGNATFSNQACGLGTMFEKSAGKEHPVCHANGTKDDEHLFLNEMEKLCNLYEKIARLKMVLRAGEESCMSHRSQSFEQLVIYVPVAEVKEKA